MISIIIGLILGIIIGVFICVFPRNKVLELPIVPGMEYRHIQDQEFIVTVTSVKEDFVTFERPKLNAFIRYSMDKHDFKMVFRPYREESQEELETE